MAIQNRNTTLPGIWAENAQTTIPTPPVAGVTYRDTTLNSTAIDKAWPFKTIVDSSDFNQHAFCKTHLSKKPSNMVSCVGTIPPHTKRVVFAWDKTENSIRP